MSGEDVQAVIEEKLSPALDGVSVPLGILSMLAFSIVLMKPNITGDELQHTIAETSQFLSLTLATLESSAPSIVN